MKFERTVVRYSPPRIMGYKTTVVTAKGSQWTIRVHKTDVPNPAGRSAYREVWCATHGGRSFGTGDTREQAVNALIRAMKMKGIVLSVPAERSPA